MPKFIPPIRIHVWGGLGSQLFAAAIAAKLQNKYQHRRLIIVLHTGGVTERLPEITTLFPNYSYQKIRDFTGYNASHEEQSNQLTFKPKQFLRKIIKSILISTGFISSCNDDEEFAQMKPWVIDLRGHYSYQKIDPIFLNTLFTALAKLHANTNADDMNYCAIHYRLGDLLHLVEKNPITLVDLFNELMNIKREIDFEKIVVYSDSPQIALERFQEIVGEKLEAPTIQTTEVLFLASQSKFFIGTSSKISFWITSIRTNLFNLQSSLPSKNLPQYRNMISGKQHLVRTYLTKD